MAPRHFYCFSAQLCLNKSISLAVARNPEGIVTIATTFGGLPEPGPPAFRIMRVRLPNSKVAEIGFFWYKCSGILLVFHYGIDTV